MITLRPYQQELYDKTKQALADGFIRPLIVAGCGAGKSYLFLKMCESISSKGKVLILVHRLELKEQHMKLFAENNIDMTNIIIESVFTVVRHLDDYKDVIAIIADESHLSKSKTWETVINNIGRICIGFTATPVRLDGKPLQDIFDIMIQTFSVGWLIDNKYLSNYRYYAPDIIDTSDLVKSGNDFSKDSLEKTMLKRAIYGDVISTYEKLAKGRKTIAYCVSVSHSKMVAEEFCKAGFKAENIDGTIPKEERKAIMERFRNSDIEILCNCMLIIEGVSISDCDCCLLLRPTMSVALYIQSSMRCMRYLPNKESLILDFVGNYQRHGLPDDEREWSLTSVPKRQREYTEDGLLSVRQCLKCYATYKSSLKVCPYCGAVMELTKQEIKNIKDIQLKEIQAERKLKTEEKSKTRNTIDDCKNVSEMYAWAKLNGKKPGYAYMAAKRKGFLR